MSTPLDCPRIECRHALFGNGVAPPWLAPLLLLTTCGLEIGTGFARAGDGKAPLQEYQLSFQGEPSTLPKLRLDGPMAEECVRFDPDGLRITLPAGHPGVRPDTGLATGIRVKGDFEITVGFEILQEPKPAGGRDKQTRFTLDVVLDRPGLNAASLSRTVYGKGVEFVSWSALQPEGAGEARTTMEYDPAEGKTARLRLARSGSVLSFYGATGFQKEFRLLRKHPFGAEELNEVRLVGSTGGADAVLDVRVTDLQLRAESLLNLPGADPGHSRGKGWLLLGVGVGVAITFSLLGVWLYMRHRDQAQSRLKSRF